MERRGYGKQSFANGVKEKPKQQYAEQTLHDAHKTDETLALGQTRCGEFQQAGGADEPIIVFGDAFAAKKMAALRAARRRFTLRVIEATLMRQR